ncbi:MAG: rhodanese-related sulfurtransferase [Candidatus Pacebacteria bacterium]|nr:rhodanese-related sulfurtransferase [Candidatus Paceibacterota bacterium]
MTVTVTPMIKADMRPRAEKKAAIAKEQRPRTTLSFYRYVRLVDPMVFQTLLYTKLHELECLGRIYVASEGINAQMNVPTDNFDAFDAFLQSLPELVGTPYKIAVEEKDFSSFYKLTIKVRKKIVADGLDDTTFDVTNTGAYLTAAEMNAYIDDPEAVVVDMRNAYESEVGRFDGAILPQVDTFREELAVAPELLKIHKNKKIALYCTGGIRCEKASAWLKHNGFTDVRHLKGGIIDYAHQVKEQGLPNKFHGTNFVFDERLAERISDEIISHCHLCRVNKSDTHYHCKNQICHVLFLGCDDCIAKYHGYCSRKCEVMDKLPTRTKKVLARYYNRFFRPAQFKKAPLRHAH